jgi:two-component system, NarL family, sensor kinase
MSPRAAGWLAWSLVALASVSWAVGIGLLARVPPERVGGPARFWPDVSISFGMLAYAALGGLVAARRPRNPVGWLFLAMGVIYQIRTLAGGIATSLWSAGVEVPTPLGSLLLWALTFWSLSSGLLPLILLLFPDGRLPSPRWRPVVWLVVVEQVLSLVSADVQFGPFVTGPRPLAVFGPEVGAAATYALQGVSSLILLVALALGVAALVGRLRRARGDALLQVKWFAYAAVVFAILITTQSVPQFVPDLRVIDPEMTSPAGMFLGLPFVLALVALPLAAAIAILRHHLYDIDLLINRTLVYGGLTACVVAIYVLVVGYLGLLFQTSGSSTVIALAATGLVAVLFQPLRERLQRGVNRLLYGQRDEPYAVLSRLGQRLGASLPPEAVLPTIVRTVAEALKLPYAAVAFEQDGSLAIAAAVGAPGSEPVRLPLTYQGAAVGALLLGPRGPGETFSATDRCLLEDLAHQAGVAVHAVGLTAELQRSRERLVLAREEERRRLRRDLHDGLGPVLASLFQRLDGAAGLVERDPTAAAALLGGLREQVKVTIGDLRRLVYALRPPALDEFGLVAAIREQAAQYEHADGLRVVVAAPDALPSLPAAVEVAAFRIALEGLTNVVRHAHARTCHVRLDLTDALHLEITDDGTGLPDPLRTGVGLTSMRERAAELGGECRIESEPAGGTRVSARLPVPKA